MQKKLVLLSSLALIMLFYLIWRDPSGTAGLFKDFFGAIGDFLGSFWDKISTFVESL